DTFRVKVERFAARVPPELEVERDPEIRWQHSRRFGPEVPDGLWVVTRDVGLSEPRGRRENAGLDQPGARDDECVAALGARDALGPIPEIRSRELLNGRRVDLTECDAIRLWPLRCRGESCGRGRLRRGRWGGLETMLPEIGSDPHRADQQRRAADELHGETNPAHATSTTHDSRPGSLNK